MFFCLFKGSPYHLNTFSLSSAVVKWLGEAAAAGSWVSRVCVWAAGSGQCWAGRCGGGWALKHWGAGLQRTQPTRQRRLGRLLHRGGLHHTRWPTDEQQKAQRRGAWWDAAGALCLKRSTDVRRTWLWLFAASPFSLTTSVETAAAYWGLWHFSHICMLTFLWFL